MKILILITARAGSKRIIKKNKKLLGKKPLIFWTLQVAKKIKNICDILVSTDDNEIAIFSKKNGVLVPWLRPKVLSGDNISSERAALHALKWYENQVQKVDGLLLLQPTSPFRNLKIFKKIINSYKKNFNKNYISVSKSKSFNISKNFKKNNNIRNNYIPNGSFYLISPKDLRNKKSFAPNNSIPLIINSMDESLDIDDRNDWNLAKLISKNQ